MKSKAERLEEAFNLHAESTDRNDAAGMADARKLIHRIYMECVPGYGMKRFFDSSDPEKWGDQYTEKLECKCDGWNACREETLKNIEELR